MGETNGLDLVFKLDLDRFGSLVEI